MEELLSLLEKTWLDNYIWQYGAFLLFILAGLLLKKLFSRIISLFIYKLFKNYTEYIQAENFIKLLSKPIKLTLMLVFILLAFLQLSFPEHWNLAPKHEYGLNMIFYRSYLVLFISSIIWLCLRLSDFMKIIMIRRAEQKGNIHSMNQLIPFFIDAAKLITLILGVFVILSSVFNINIGTLVAGIGLGGLAIAFAAKESLENLVSSFTILLDKPFVVGDLVQVGDILGTVEKIGFRSTRIRTLEKSYVTLPNKKMVDQELDNLSLRTDRRAMFDIRLTYSTSGEQIHYIINDIEELIKTHPKTIQKDSMVRFKGFGENSLEIMVLFFVKTTDWAEFLNVKQEVNFKIMEIVKDHNASFAIPSRNIYISKQE